MCTVTYLPTPKGFILTHNRDEAPHRSPKSLVREKNAGGDTLLFPRDTAAGGTWIATAASGRTACLLNGAFELHTRQLPYRRSRGLLLLDFFDWPDPDAFFERYELDNIEPFTFLYFQPPLAEAPARVVELRWDGERRHLRRLSAAEPHFWCSATLYPAEMQLRRKQIFLDWLQRQPSAPESPQAIRRLHRSGSLGDPENDFVMKRSRVQTVSITQVLVDEKNARMQYNDLLGRNRSERRLILGKRQVSTVNR